MAELHDPPLPKRWPPKPNDAAAVPYYAQMGAMCERHLGTRPSRTTMWQWLKWGFPVYRNGPRVRVPTFRVMRRPFTTQQALHLFFQRVGKMERQAQGR